MKCFRRIFTLLFIFSFSLILLGNEWANYYFPDKLGSFWVYEDQNGQELTRYAVEGVDIDGEKYRAFNYEPQLEDWTEFGYIIHPYFYRVSDHWVTLSVGEEYENAIEANFNNSMEEARKQLIDDFNKQVPPELPISIDLNYTVDVDVQDDFYFLPTPANLNEEWTSMIVNIDITTEVEVKSEVVEVQQGDQSNTLSISMVETGKITGKETVETAAGRFEDCLKIEFSSDVTIKNSDQGVEGIDSSHESENAFTINSSHGPENALTTVWLAPHVGIVKITKEKITEEETQTDEVTTIELTRYEIKTDESETK